VAYQTTALALRYVPQIVYGNLTASSAPLTSTQVDDIHLDAYNDIGLALRTAGFDPDDLDSGSRAERWAKTQEALLTSGYSALAKEGVNEDERTHAYGLISRAVTAVGGWDPVSQKEASGTIHGALRGALLGEGANEQLAPASSRDTSRRSDDAEDGDAYVVGEGIPYADRERQQAISGGDPDIGGPSVVG